MKNKMKIAPIIEIDRNEEKKNLQTIKWKRNHQKKIIE